MTSNINNKLILLTQFKLVVVNYIKLILINKLTYNFVFIYIKLNFDPLNFLTGFDLNLKINFLFIYFSYFEI